MDSRARSIADFYTLHDAMTKAYSSIAAYERGEGTGDAEAETLKAEQRFPRETRLALERGRTKIDRLQKEKRRIDLDPDLDGATKALDIAAIEREMVDVAREALGRSPLR